jgi:hypothetical protein
MDNDENNVQEISDSISSVIQSMSNIISQKVADQVINKLNHNNNTNNTPQNDFDALSNASATIEQESQRTMGGKRKNKTIKKRAIRK